MFCELCGSKEADKMAEWVIKSGWGLIEGYGGIFVCPSCVKKHKLEV